MVRLYTNSVFRRVPGYLCIVCRTHDSIARYLLAAKCDTPLSEYNPEDQELDGFVELDIETLYKLASGEINSMPATALLRQSDGGFAITEIDIKGDDFLLYTGETLANKYALWLREVCEKIS